MCDIVVRREKTMESLGLNLKTSTLQNSQRSNVQMLLLQVIVFALLWAPYVFMHSWSVGSVFRNSFVKQGFFQENAGHVFKGKGLFDYEMNELPTLDN